MRQRPAFHGAVSSVSSTVTPAPDACGGEGLAAIARSTSTMRSIGPIHAPSGSARCAGSSMASSSASSSLAVMTMRVERSWLVTYASTAAYASPSSATQSTTRSVVSPNGELPV